MTAETRTAVPWMPPTPSLRGRSIALLQRGLEVADRTLGARRGARFCALLLVYSLLLATAFLLAYAIRWDFALPPEQANQRTALLLPVIACKLALLHSFGQFRSILSYFGLADLGSLLLAAGTVSGVMYGLWYVSADTAAVARGVILVDFILTVAFLSGFRLTLRMLRAQSPAGSRTEVDEPRRAAIIGTGDLAEVIVRNMLQHRTGGPVPIFVVDDSPQRIGRLVHGLPVVGPLAELPKLGRRARINELVVALADAPPRRLRAIMELGRSFGARTQVIPSLPDLMSGTAKVDSTRPVQIEDLLGRAPVRLESAAIAGLLAGQVVAVTGAGGSIGSELCRQILAANPERLLLIEQSEIALFDLEAELTAAGHACRIVPLIADIGDDIAMRTIFDRFHPAIAFHAAAYKHVPLMERQPAEAVKNNAIATARLAQLASASGVARFVLISTDKAINPTSVMGCTKRLAERLLQAEQRRSGNRTAFLAVRFGNVLGSSGSVIPVFRRQIAAGGPVTVTHPEMTRYFMTIPEAVGLVLQTAVIGRGGDVYVLDMSRPVRIYDMARQMIELSGYRPEIDIEIVFTGLRPGEKLFEEMRHDQETHEATVHERIFRLRHEGPVPDVDQWIRTLAATADLGDANRIKHHLRELVPEYRPHLEPDPTPALRP